MAEHCDTTLAVVLATDHYETIRPVVRRLRQQTIRKQLELVLQPSTVLITAQGRPFPTAVCW